MFDFYMGLAVLGVIVAIGLTYVIIRLVSANREQSASPPANGQTATSGMSSGSDPGAHNQVGVYWPIYILTVLFVAALAAVAIGLWPLSIEIRIMAGLYALLSLRLIDTDERGAITVLNLPIFVSPPGPAVVLFLLGEVVRVPQTGIQREFPNDPEKTFKGKDDEPLPTGMDRPIRITTGGPLPKAEYENGEHKGAGPHLNFQMSVEQNAAVRWRIQEAFTFLVRMDGKSVDDKIADVNRQIADGIVKVLTREYAKRPVGLVIHDHDKISDALIRELNELTESWGIHILQVLLKAPDITREVNLKLSGIVEASAEADATTRKAEGTRQKNRLERTGQGEGEKGFIEAVGQGTKTAAADMQMDGREVFALTAAERIIGDNDKFVFGADGLTQAVASGMTLADSFKNGGGQASPAPQSGQHRQHGNQPRRQNPQTPPVPPTTP